MYTTRIEFFVIDILTLHDIFYGTETVVSIIDDEVLPESETIDKHPEKKRCNRMKRPYGRESWSAKWIDGGRFYPESSSYSLSHLFGSLIGKGDTKNTARIDMPIGNHRDHSFGNGMSFS